MYKEAMNYGDALDLIPKHLKENSIHAVITDPPYGIHVLGQKWDSTLPNNDIWKACYNVLRPGGFCVSFGHSRMYHRLCCQLEDVGFEIKECLCWGYATGNPRPLNIDRAMAKTEMASESHKWKGWANNLKRSWEPVIVAQKTNAYTDCVELMDLIEKLGVIDENLEDLPTLSNSKEYCSLVNNKVLLTETGRELLKEFGITRQYFIENDLLCKRGIRWKPIAMAQKPLEGKYVTNIAKHNVGGLNIDACRIPYKNDADKKALESFQHFTESDYGDDRYFSVNSGNKKQCNIHPDGRWPANLVWLDPLFIEYDHIFMVPKPTRKEKGIYNNHDTVKPVRLMERLIQMVTPRPSIVNEEVIVLDPFAGSGSTGIAARNLGRKFIGFEINKDSFKVAKKRLKEQVSNYRDIFSI